MVFLPPSRAAIVDRLVSGWLVEPGAQSAAIVIGPQGFGKRTMVNAVIEAFRAKRPPVTAIEVDASRYGSSGEADLAETFRRLAVAMASAAKISEDGVAKLPWGRIAPTQVLHNALTTVVARAIAGNIIVCFNNVDSLNTARSGESLLNLLRSWSEAHFDAPLDRVFLLATSADRPRQDKADHSIINWPTFGLSPLDERDIAEQLESEGRRASAREESAILAQTGGFPLLLRFALDATTSQPAADVVAWLERAEHSTLFTEWSAPHSRFITSMPFFQNAIREMLEGRGAPSDTHSKPLLELERRGFVVLRDERYVPAGEVITRWLRQIAT
jgi:hypothetical protein